MADHAAMTVRGYHSVLHACLCSDIGVNHASPAIDANGAVVGLVVVQTVLIREVTHGAQRTVVPWRALLPRRGQLLNVASVAGGALRRLILPSLAAVGATEARHAAL